MEAVAATAEISIEEMARVIDAAELPTPVSVTPAAPVRSVDVISSIKAFVSPEQLQKDVSFSVNDLDSAVMQQAGMFAHYASQKVAAMRQHERMKAAFEILESQLDHLYRSSLKGENAKTTEAQIAGAVKCDSRWWAAQQRLIDAKAVFELARDACSAFDHRRDMIVQISVDRRREREGQLRIMGAPGQANGLPDRSDVLAVAAAVGKVA